MLKLIALPLFVLIWSPLSLAKVKSKDPIRVGVYKLNGTNPDGILKYDGKIVIFREGTNYRVTWFIGPQLAQGQTGVGILENKVLSIGYMDRTGRDFGVVSMKVIDNGKLKGKWASLLSQGSYGEEEFTFEAESVPNHLVPLQMEKPKNEEKAI